LPHFNAEAEARETVEQSPERRPNGFVLCPIGVINALIIFPLRMGESRKP
jgi:hypothetical protein